MSKKVLIVEDEAWRYDDWCQKLDSKVILLFASSIREAEKQFATNPDLDAIVVDACVPGGVPNTTHLIQKFRETFHGPMIAISSSWAYLKQLLDAGCNHCCPEKEDVPAKVLEVLGLS